jgi:hypothetical protein
VAVAAVEACPARARSANALTSVPDSSISAIRAVAARGSPFSTVSPVGTPVAGSIVSTQNPSNGTRRVIARVAWRANSGTVRPCRASPSTSRRTRSGAAAATTRV